LHRYVLALDVTGFVEALAERGGKGRIRRSGIDECDYRHLRLLRPRRGRPRSRRAADERDELAPFHCPMPPVLPTERIAHLCYGRRLLRCGISIRPMSGLGQKRTLLVT